GGSLPWLAAAALVLIMLGGWWTSVRQTVQQDLAERTPEELREILLAEGEDVLLTPLTATADPSAADAGGEVSWSPLLQTGYMTIVGLEPNDPAQSQYQLWIFDATRDERFPVDGGVFDVPAGADEVVIPIDAKIEVREATLFAITVEKPGGVVVSDRERIVLVAQPE
ncbi:MAG: anti-sigma factor, partial [Gemmatimonadetes bacterium]|nr:anti-sigma factor [Gemmatimonadota bacterium]